MEKEKRIRIAGLAVLAIALVAYAIIGMDYMNQKSDQDDLNARMDPLKLIIQGKASEPQASNVDEDLQQRLAEAKADLAAVEESFPTNLNSTDIIETILQLAEESNVDILPLQMSPAERQVIEEHAFDTVAFSIDASGSYSDLLEFIDLLENGPIVSMRVVDAKLVGSGESWLARLAVDAVSQAIPEEQVIPEDAANPSSD